MNDNLKQIVNPLVDWFIEKARILPWRENPTPYRVWVSEIMLQQTRVEAVKPYYQRFMKALPDVKALADCPENQILKLWEGLGYYSRVRNMQKAACQVMEEYDGKLPADYQELLKLKGIGSYTAGAIASIAYGIPVPAVDGNVLRVISRVKASEEDITLPAVKRAVEEELLGILPKDKPGQFNQALMELGALVCVPNGMAKCDKCPIADICKAKVLGKVEELPKRTAKKQRRIEYRTVLILKDGEKIAIEKRPNKGLLAGLYELPNVKGRLSADEVLERLKDRHLSPIRILQVGEAKHIFSHVEWRMTGYAVSIEEPEDPGNLLFVEPGETQKSYPIPAAFAYYTEYLNIKLGQKKFEKQER